MIPLIIILAAVVSLAVGFFIGRDWYKVDASERYDEGWNDGFQKGVETYENRRGW